MVSMMMSKRMEAPVIWAEESFAVTDPFLCVKWTLSIFGACPIRSSFRESKAQGNCNDVVIRQEMQRTISFKIFSDNLTQFNYTSIRLSSRK
jgi:hypothetical protein